MATLYEIDEEILDCVDQETGKKSKRIPVWLFVW